jgi:hypothetical protein
MIEDAKKKKKKKKKRFERDTDGRRRESCIPSSTAESFIAISIVSVMIKSRKFLVPFIVSIQSQRQFKCKLSSEFSCFLQDLSGIYPNITIFPQKHTSSTYLGIPSPNMLFRKKFILPAWP